MLMGQVINQFLPGFHIKVQSILPFSDLYKVSPAFQDQTAYQECPVFRGRKDLREGKVQKDKTVIKDHKECRVHGETEGAKGLSERVDHQESRE